jgi:hypothetical protein
MNDAHDSKVSDRVRLDEDKSRVSDCSIHISSLMIASTLQPDPYLPDQCFCFLNLNAVLT